MTALEIKRTFSPDSQVAPSWSRCRAVPVLAELYIEALLADEALADEVWALWDAGVITDDMAAWGWAMLALGRVVKHCELAQNNETNVVLKYLFAIHSS